MPSRIQLYLLILISFAFVFNACSSSQEIVGDESISNQHLSKNGCFDTSLLTAEDRVLADSLLYDSLNNTGLHTFISTLKPMSDVVAYRWQVEPDDSTNTTSESFKDEYEQLNRIAASFSCGPIRTVITPFKMLFNGERYVQLRVVNKDAIETMLATYPEFWSRWAFAGGSDPAVMIQTMEYEDRFDRFRGYGYLYGYPSHGVDFFVDAAKSQAETGDFVERDFMQMPVVSGRTGMFVYAVPKGHEQNNIDREIKRLASENVDLFNELAPDYYDESGNFDGFSFLRDFHMNTEQSVVLTR